MEAPSVIVPKIPSPTLPGIYHRVEKGQTLWQISKLYNVDLEELVEINRISDATKIETGQMIFIPQYKTPQIIYEKFSAEDFIWPVNGKVINYFGQISNGLINKGINIKISNNPEVVAARSGKVVFYSQNLKGYGKTIIIDHGDGLSTVYAGLSEVFIQVGDNVKKGSLIGRLDLNESKNKNLHFEIRKGYTPQNPYFYLP